MAKKNKEISNVNHVNSPPTGLQVIFREFMKDKLAMFSLVVLVAVIIGIFFWAYFMIDQQQLMRVSLRDKFGAQVKNSYLVPMRVVKISSDKLL